MRQRIRARIQEHREAMVRLELEALRLRSQASRLEDQAAAVDNDRVLRQGYIDELERLTEEEDATASD